MFPFITKVLRKIFSFLYTNKIDTREVLNKVSEIVVEKAPEKIIKSREEILQELNLENYQNEVYINEFKEGRPTLFILDDLPSTEILYTIDFKNINNDYNFDVEEKFNVIMVYGRKVGFAALKFFKKNIKIDYAILDITIDSLEKFDNGDYLDLDGIDIAIELNRICKDTKIIFSSAHTLNVRNNLMLEYITKYENHFKNDITKHSIDKNSTRYKVIYNFLRK